MPPVTEPDIAKMNNDFLVGRAIALGSAVFYSFNTTLSRLAYDVGTTPVSLTAYRFLITAVLMVAIVLALRKSWRLSVSPWLFVFCVVGVYATSIGHLGAVHYIPVSLAAIIFYTFPLQVIAWKRLVHRQAVNRYEFIGFSLAFAGIATALGPQFQQMDPLGLLLAIGGSLGATVFILSYERFPADIDSSTASMWITLGTVVLCILSLQFGFELTPPGESSGWMFLGAIALCSVASFIFALVAIQKIGGSVFALFLNFEPVMILLLAWLVIGEELSSERIIGIAMVVVALVISQWKNPASAIDSHS